jgi:hypothetical protein
MQAAHSSSADPTRFLPMYFQRAAETVPIVDCPIDYSENMSSPKAQGTSIAGPS